jgi:uncharacterized protein involved in exopolysaccharide biosynthesis
MNTKAIVLVVGAAVCVAAISGCGRKYTATSWLRIKAEGPAFVARSAGTLSDEEFGRYKATQRELLMSPPVLTAALRRRDVVTLPNVQTETENGDPVKWLERHIKVEFPNKAEIMLVSCTTSDPHEAAVLTKAVVDAYMTEIVNAEQELRRRRLSELERLVSEREMELRNKQTALNQLISASLAGNAKAASAKSDSADIVVLRSEIKSLEQVLHEVAMERERMKMALQAPPRISVLALAEEPLVPD